MARTGSTGGPNLASRQPLAALRLIEASARSLSALGPAAAKRGPAADRQLSGAACPFCADAGNAQQPCDVNATAFRTAGRVTIAANQGLKRMIAGLALVFIKWHGRNDSSDIGAKGEFCGGRSNPDGGTETAHWGILEGKPGVVNAGTIG